MGFQDKQQQTIPAKPKSRKEKWILVEGKTTDAMGDVWETTVECKGLEPRAQGKNVKTTLVLTGKCHIPQTQLLALGVSPRVCSLLGDVSISHSYPVQVSCPFEKLPINADVLLKKFHEIISSSMTSEKKREMVERELQNMKLSHFHTDS